MAGLLANYSYYTAATLFVGPLLSMVGQDAVGDMPQDTSDYVRTWTRANDRGGLQYISNDAYRCFLAD